MRLPLFSRVKRAYCSCLPKYNINPYLGRCEHGCIYCYAPKFPSFNGPVKPRLNLKSEIVDMVKEIGLKMPVMLSDCTDPYQPLEEKYGITRRCLEVLSEHGFPLLIVTKSDMVVRDLDIFKRTSTVVSITITTLREDLASLIEPAAPPPEDRFTALKRIADEGIPTIVRIDPIIPSLNSDRESVEEIISKAASIGVRQVTASTFKPIRGFFKYLKERYGWMFRSLYESYIDGVWISGYKYLNREKSFRLLRMVRDIALKYKLEFAACREGFPELNTTICDGTAYCRRLLTDYF